MNGPKPKHMLICIIIRTSFSTRKSVPVFGVKHPLLCACKMQLPRTPLCLQKALLEIHTNSAAFLLMKLIKKGVQKRPTSWYNSLHTQNWEEDRSAV